MTAIKVYISGALMAAKNLDTVKQLYNDIAEVCTKNGLQPYLPHNNTDPVLNNRVSNKEVFKKDYEELITSSLVISYIGEPSLGVGAELSICVSNQIPIVLVVERNRKVSRFMMGMLEASNNVQLIEFGNKKDLEEKLHICLRTFKLNDSMRLATNHVRPHLFLHNVHTNDVVLRESFNKRPIPEQTTVLF